MRLTEAIDGEYVLKEEVTAAEAICRLGQYEDLGSIDYLELQREALRNQASMLREYIKKYGELLREEQKGRILSWKKQS